MSLRCFAFAWISVIALFIAQPAGAYPFDLKVHKTGVLFDGMGMEVYYLKMNEGDGVILFTHPPNWSFRNNETGITVVDSTLPSSTIQASFQPAFLGKTEESLKQEIINDATGDLGGEVQSEPEFEQLVLGRQPRWKGYQVKLVYSKFGRSSCRAVVYFQINNKDVIKVRMNVPPDRADQLMKNAKQWVTSFRKCSAEEFEILQKKGT